MTVAQRRIFAWVLLLAWAVAGAAWLATLDFDRKLSTDVLDLIPADEREPELALVRELASEAEARTLLFVLTEANGTPASLAAATKFAAELHQMGGFTQVVALGDSAWRDAVGRELFAHRFTLLFPTWLRENETEALPSEIAKKLKAFLEKPEALAFQDLVPADPLLLLPDALERMKAGLALTQPENGGAASHHLVWAQLAMSPLSEPGQAPVFAAIERTKAKLAADFPGVDVAFTGVNRFAAESRRRIEREVAWLNTASLLAVLVVAAVFIRRVHRALHLLPVVAFGILGAWIATTIAFDRVHVIVLVLGALLTGVAIDYGFYLYMQPPATPDEDYVAKVRRLAKPLLASCLTTVAGFALLLFSELPMMRQLGVYVGAGLVSALVAAVIYFATVRHAYLEPRAWRTTNASAARHRGARGGRWVVIASLLVALGIVRVAWKDDIRGLEVPDQALQAEDARIRAAFGQRGERRIFLTHGPTLREAREALHAFERWLGGRAPIANLAGIVPTARAQENARRFVGEHPEFPRQLREALAAEGFDAAAFEPFFTAYADYVARTAAQGVDGVVRALQQKLAGPLALLLHVGERKSWFVSIVGNAPAESPPPEARTVSASQLQSLNRLLGNYRATAVRLSLVGLALVGAGVFLTYGVRDGGRIFAIPCGACLVTFGLFGWLGQPLSLFHILGAFLGVCLAHNYSIFSATSAYRGEATPVSVRLSALTTATSFGVLACSGIPVVRALGATVTLIVIVAWALIEARVLAGLSKANE